MLITRLVPSLLNRGKSQTHWKCRYFALKERPKRQMSLQQITEGDASCSLQLAKGRGSSTLLCHTGAAAHAHTSPFLHFTTSHFHPAATSPPTIYL